MFEVQGPLMFVLFLIDTDVKVGGKMKRLADIMKTCVVM